MDFFQVSSKRCLRIYKDSGLYYRLYGTLYGIKKNVIYAKNVCAQPKLYKQAVIYNAEK